MTLPVVAAFDFDGTLTRSDSVVPFLRKVAVRPPLPVRLARQGHRLVAAFAARDRDRLRRIASEAVFRGMPVATVEAHAAEHGRAIVSRGLREDTVARLRWHIGEGHQVVIVSASYEHYVRVVGEHLGVAGVVATRLESGPDATLTGRLDGANCRAEEKLRRLDAWLAERSLARDGIELWAYGDSAGDRELLAAADHPVWVSRRLDSVAPSSA